MIAKLRGVVDSSGEDWAVVDVGGVGYHLFCSARTLRELPPPGAAAELYVHTHVREEHIHLYGFADPDERDWFRRLQTVQGVGSRLALAVLSALEPAQLARAVAAEDRAALTRVSGVGARTAGRILAELKDKAGSIVVALAAGTGRAGTEGAAAEAMSALVNLGYSRSESLAAIAAAGRGLGPEAGVEALIRGGLKELAP